MVVVGGGITGVTAAYLLKRDGKRVALLEKERIGSGMTGQTSAHLTFVTDLRLTELVKRFGDEAARLTWGAGRAAIDFIERACQEHRIPAGFVRVPNFLCKPFDGTSEDANLLADELQAAREFGVAATPVDSDPISGRAAIAYADQAVFDPLAYVTSLAREVNGDGSFVCENTEVTGFEDEPLSVNANDKTVRCDYVVIATHVPLMGTAGLIRSTLFQTKLYPYSTYVTGARATRGSLAPALFSDLADPYYYLRLHEDGEGLYAVFGGNDHKTGQESDTEACYDDLTRTLQRILPGSAVDRRWSGQVVETGDGLPYIGETAERQFAATGFSGTGLSFGTVAGMMAADAASGRGNPCADLFDPQRKAFPRGAGTVLSENVDFLRYFAEDRLREGRSDNLDDIAPGDAKVLRVNGEHVACYRAPEGKLHAVSAVCTHMKCLVRWNPAERTWDCPCHGSRFQIDGTVLGGPAEEPLAPLSAVKRA